MYILSQIFIVLSIIFSFQSFIWSDSAKTVDQYLALKPYLLPSNHPLQKKLKKLFKRSNMFKSSKHLHKAGFSVLARVHRGLMVANHPSIKNYLFKKFKDKISQKDQLENYLQRIKGARVLGQFIRDNKLQHIIVPQKWLYALPKRFSSSKSKKASYILIVEKMSLYKGGKDPSGKLAQKYYHIEEPILKELCTVVYHFRGLDSFIHNLPFTHQGKIAFIDTEKWEIKREGFLSRLMPYLTEDNKAYALSVFQELQKP